MKKIYFLILIFITINAYCQTAGTAYVEIETPLSICHPGDCIDVTANYATTNTTTSYQVASVPYIQSFPFFGGVQLFPTDDDKWSQTVNLPFSFCFYGQNYNKLLVGANGVVTFDIQTIVPGGVQIPAGDCPWSFSGPIPNASFPIKNAIYGVYQDTNLLSTAVTNPAIQNVNYYITGTAPNRAYIINFNQLPQYQCDGSAGLQTSQIILYETTNIIDVLVSNRTACNSWQSGAGVVGIQNQAGTHATVPSGRNTGNWSATNEAWRFTPNGNSNTTFSWSLNGVYFGNNNPVNVCPNDGDILQAIVTYTACDGVQTQIMDNLTLNIVPEPAIMNPLNIETCVVDNTVPAAFNLDQGAYILNGLSPLEYSVDYFTSSSIIPHANLNAFMSTGETIYAYITHTIDTGCLTIKTFDLILNTIPAAPTGNSTQAYTEGQTLANLQVVGDNIIWYSDEFGQTVLPSTTVLVDGVTYYAAQSNASGCVSGKNSMLNSGRLAVTVYNVLSTDSFDANAFKAYPNPVKDILNLSYTKEISSVSVFNLVGQEVLTKSIHATQSQINLSSLSGGTYLVKVTVDGLVKTIKVVKE